MANIFNVLLNLQIFLNVIICNQFSQKCIEFNGKSCESVPEFNEQLKQQLKNISSDAQKIIDFVVNGSDKGVTYQEMAKFVDKFGARMAGDKNLEKSIDYMTELLKNEKHDKVYTEELPVPHWIRGKEWAQMVAPRNKTLNILGLGYSVGTNGTVLTADVIVVKSFDELKNRSNEVMGKIVVYNFDYETYGKQGVYRRYGATFAAKYGAVAALVRSLTSYSIDSPHTGAMSYNDSSVPKIPAVSITVEDAELFSRITARGETVRVSLYMEAFNAEPTISRNTISEITGTKYPDEVVIVSGHIDSWDVGQGAMDDAGGVFISWRALSVIKKLGLQPKRTIRSVLWTAEEIGLIGAKAYVQRHLNELNKTSIAMEADTGTFSPLGITFSGKNLLAQCIVHEIMQWLKPINASRLNLCTEGSDIEMLMEKGVLGSSLENENQRYFDFHHTNGDTMSIIDKNVMDRNTALWALTSYAFASLDQLLPK